MVPLLSLWLPILLSAAGVFILSAIINMLLPYHRSDYPALPNEDAVMDALRPFNIPPGEYAMPRAQSNAHMNSPEFREKWSRGPVGILTFMKHDTFGMGSRLVNWFIYVVIISIFAAYITGRALAPGADYMQVFRFASTVAFLGYAGALWQQTIWYNHKLSTTLKSTFDALLFGLLTGGFFGWLWP
jgi:hypothetical protein